MSLLCVYLIGIGYRRLCHPDASLHWQWLDGLLMREKSARITSVKYHVYKIRGLKSTFTGLSSGGCSQATLFLTHQLASRRMPHRWVLNTVDNQICLCSSIPTRLFYPRAKAWNRLHCWYCCCWLPYFELGICSERCTMCHIRLPSTTVRHTW